MKKLLTKILIAVLMVPLAMTLTTNAVSPSWNVTGNYTFTFNLGGDYAHHVTLSQDIAGNITGNGGYPAGGPDVYSWSITSGNTTANNINFTAQYTVGADALSPLTTMNVTGTIALDGTMSGTWTDNYQGGSRYGTWKSTSGTASPIVTTSMVVVTGNTSAGENMPGWMFNRDITTATPYVFDTTASSIGSGSLHILPIGATATDKMVAENFINTPISNVKSISYDFRIGSTGNSSQAGQFYMNVYANFGSSDPLKFYDCRYNVVAATGSTSGFTTVTFDPTQAYPVTTRGSSPFTCPAVPADMNTLSAGSNIRVFALNVGDTSTSDVGVSGHLDKVIVSTVFNTTTYDFEPVPVIVKTKDDCKNGGWKTFTNPKFKNQGQCVSSFERNEKADRD